MMIRKIAVGLICSVVFFSLQGCDSDVCAESGDSKDALIRIWGAFTIRKIAYSNNGQDLGSIIDGACDRIGTLEHDFETLSELKDKLVQFSNSAEEPNSIEQTARTVWTASLPSGAEIDRARAQAPQLIEKIDLVLQIQANCESKFRQGLQSIPSALTLIENTNVNAACTAAALAIPPLPGETGDECRNFGSPNSRGGPDHCRQETDNSTVRTQRGAPVPRSTRSSSERAGE